jgi:hypothetical protein
VKNIVLISFILIIVLGCQKEELNEEVDFGYDYSGLVVGKYVIYDVVSIVYDDFTLTSDTSLFQIKEVVDSKYIDGTGNEAYKIIRYKRITEPNNWESLDVWSSKLTNTTYEVVEENQRFIKLIFPLKLNKTWNGNSKNNLPTWDYEYKGIDNPETIGNLQFDYITTVVQFDDENEILIQRDFAEEKYAKNVGLIYKKVIDVEKDYNPQTFLWEITKGIDYTMTINSYGN